MIPDFDGAFLSQAWKDALWDKFYTAAPRRQRRCVEQYKIVKRASGLWPDATGSIPRPSPGSTCRKRRSISASSTLAPPGRKRPRMSPGLSVNAGARRHAYRRVRIGGGKSRAARGQPVDVRRLDEKMAVTAGRLLLVLVGHDVEDVSCRHGPLLFLRQDFTALARPGAL